MKKFLPWIVAGLFLVILLFGSISINNTLVDLDERVDAAWSQVENVSQRRFDLIPNLVETVKGYAKHERELLESVTQARASIGQVKVNNPGDIKKWDESQAGLTQALSRLMVVAERYPEIKADKNFLELQSQLEGTENRMTIERQNFNEAARALNVAIKKFPGSLIAGFKGLKERDYFTAQTEAKTAPKVNFGN